MRYDLSLPLEGSEAEAPPVADEARRRRLAKRAAGASPRPRRRGAANTATIEPDGIGGAAAPDEVFRCGPAYLLHLISLLRRQLPTRLAQSSRRFAGASGTRFVSFLRFALSATGGAKLRNSRGSLLESLPLGGSGTSPPPVAEMGGVEEAGETGSVAERRLWRMKRGGGSERNEQRKR